jgi:rhodanese-related sulfurtransferase
MLLSSGISVNAYSENKQTESIFVDKVTNLGNGYTNITVNDTYDLLTDDTTLEIPIDVRRTADEWYPQRIDTPIPEHPRHFCLDLFQNDSILPKFLERYAGKSVILYCKGGYRSFLATKILIANNFSGTIYNMIGGITAWNAAALPTAPGGIYNITVNETLALCSDTSNSFQNPIDVRYWDSEWKTGFVDTPWPESPIYYFLDWLKDEDGLNAFLDEFIGQEVILYCKGGYRSLVGSYILKYANFSGTLYNMLGGITEWQKYHPIRNNTPPGIPEIEGPEKVKVEEIAEFTIGADDAEGDGVCFVIDWDDGNVETTGFIIGGSDTIVVGHNWTAKGTYTISVKAVDFYDNVSDIKNFSIRVPKSVNYNFNFINWLLERFPNAFPLLRQLIKA